MKFFALAAVAGAGLAALAMLYKPTPSPLASAWASKRAVFTLQQRVQQYGPDVATRLALPFSAAGVAYPPHEIAYVAFKDQRLLEVYARNSSTAPWRYVTQYPVLGTSGRSGPKLKEGDKQVPEGIYRAEWFNPNSRFHLSIRLNYPNDFDRAMVKRDGRTKLGGDIMIHGSFVSIGCLAMGDEAAEDLFILAALATRERTRIVVSPTDFRTGDVRPPREAQVWVGELYDGLRTELRQYRKEPPVARQGPTPL